MPLAMRPRSLTGPEVPPPVSAAAQHLAHEGEARALVVAEGADGAAARSPGCAGRPRRSRRRACADRSQSRAVAVRSARPPAASCRPGDATSTLPSATSEVAKSSTSGRPGSGTPTQKGAVEKRRSTPPKGATSTLPATLTKWMEISPAAIAISAQSPTRPIWPALRSAMTADAVSAARARCRVRTACGATVWPKPHLPSSTAKAPPSVTISAVLALHDEAGLQPFDVARHAHHAVAVMARRGWRRPDAWRCGRPPPRRSRRRRRRRAPGWSSASTGMWCMCMGCCRPSTAGCAKSPESRGLGLPAALRGNVAGPGSGEFPPPTLPLHRRDLLRLRRQQSHVGRVSPASR